MPGSLNAFLDRVVGRIEQASALDPVADRAAALVQPALSAAPIRTAISGTAAGHPIHPVLVTVPIGSWCAALYLDLCGTEQDRDAARRLVGLGLLGALPTAVTGAADWAYTTGAERRVGFVHAMLNYAGISAFVASWLARRRGRSGVASAGGGAVLLAVSGWLGGHLSYARGVGVDTTAFQVAPEDWTDVLADAELVDGTPTPARFGGLPVLVYRDQNGLFAIADRCTHRGAPLHEGELRDGCISCPWHASKFRLADGQVMLGPATRSQPSYQARVHQGSIQLRRGSEPGSLRTNPVS